MYIFGDTNLLRGFGLLFVLFLLYFYIDSNNVDKKIDGGFCTLGEKFFYDEMDDNSNNYGDLEIVEPT